MKKYNKSNMKKFTFLTSLVLFVSALLIFPNVVTAADGRQVKARVMAISKSGTGEVTIKRDGGWATLYRCEKVKGNESIRVGEGGWVELKLLNKGDKIKITSLSNIIIERMERGDKKKSIRVLLNLKYGMLRVKFSEDSDSIMTLKTGNAEFLIEKADCIFEYDSLSEKTLIVVNDIYDEGSVLVNTPKVSEYNSISVPRLSKIEIIGGQESFEVKDASIELSLFEITMKFVDERDIGSTKAIEKRVEMGEEKSLPNIDKEGKDFVSKFVSFLNSESTSGIRGMVSSRYSGNIGGFGGKTALVNGLKEQFDTGGRVRLSYSINSASATDEEGKEIIINARIGGSSVKLWIVKEGSSYNLTHAEGRWLFD